MKPYPYTRLPAADQNSIHVRIATLIPGIRTEPLTLSITVHELSFDPTIPLPISYFALSYTWGDPNDRAAVRITNPSSDEPYELTVTRGLVTALRVLRRSEDSQALWIDAICIDQSTAPASLSERKAQVHAMHHIYARATGTTIWLGPAADDSSHAMAALRSLGKSMVVDWSGPYIATSDGKHSTEMLHWEDVERSAEDRRAVEKLLGRPWFDRVWIRQEAFFANTTRSFIVCGDDGMEIEALRNAVQFLALTAIGSKELEERISLASSVLNRMQADVPNLLRKMRLSKCLDPRDRIYGMLGILNLNKASGKGVVVDVDYTPENTVETVYKNVFMRYVRSSGTLRLLGEGGLWQGQSSLSASWMPDWRINKVTDQLDLSMESAVSYFHHAECQFVDPHILRVSGRSVGPIAEDLALPTSHDIEDNPHVWEFLGKLMVGRLQGADPDKAVERLSRLLFCVLYSLFADPGELDSFRAGFRSFLRHIYDAVKDSGDISLPKDILDDDAAQKIAWAVRHLTQHDLRLFILEEQYLGLGPGCLQKGDEVWAVLGSRALLLLRNVEKMKYKLVGTCFLHGFNWGEAILGPLPAGYTVVSRFDERGRGYSPKFQSTNGEETRWDPRINWDELVPDDTMEGASIVTDAPGEPIRLLPRVDYLRKRGSQIDEIDII